MYLNFSEKRLSKENDEKTSNSEENLKTDNNTIVKSDKEDDASNNLNTTFKELV